MKTYLPAIYFFIGMLFFSCSSTKVISDFDDTANFKSYKTFAFSKEAKQIPVDDLVKTRILNSIISNLKNKGLSESDTPDIIVDLAVKTKNKKDYANTNVNISSVWGKRWRFRTGIGKSYSKEINYKEGTLIINLIDKAKNHLVWKGSGTDIVKTKNLNKDAINEGIGKILESYPSF
ncbi:DUF4136 domain-containing protein [Winogradskyella alexanderae]|uniref:DUF4136 domain-containing protein n=1 Tax=Winogradskyella alexanderae TaxID=2877123 RepID=A0ABS7XWD2_9FLAO|nr:DUF4136 domain-containing protein [Winogradskyella alexanderae]MCA0133326.1 DUF4136 domain-containing protein [Winogradskyella alexanderae]